MCGPSEVEAQMSTSSTSCDPSESSVALTLRNHESTRFLVDGASSGLGNATYGEVPNKKQLSYPVVAFLFERSQEHTSIPPLLQRAPNSACSGRGFTMAKTNGSEEAHTDQLEDEKPTLMSNPYNPNSAAYLAYPVKHVVSSLWRRATEPPDQPVNKLLDAPTVARSQSGVYTPPKRTASPFQPPPLTALELRHDLSESESEALLLTRSLAEEIRLLLPPRLQLLEHWKLAFSLEIHGSSLSTLYQHCRDVTITAQRAGFILVIKDGSGAANSGSLFGAYLTDAPKPAQHYFGTGECFLWRASILPTIHNITAAMNSKTGPLSENLLELAGLPPPPSADTSSAGRTTTVRGERRTSRSSKKSPTMLSPVSSNHLEPPPISRSGTSTPDRIRFKAFPYSGMNDFMIYCEPSFLSIGGGDGHYGLFLDDQLDKGISETCPTFGNEPLSEEGRKFEVCGVEIWYVGA